MDEWFDVNKILINLDGVFQKSSNYHEQKALEKHVPFLKNGRGKSKKKF